MKSALIVLIYGYSFVYIFCYFCFYETEIRTLNAFYNICLMAAV